MFDTNIVLDVLLDRRPHVAVASRLMMHVERANIDGLLAATTVTTIHYLATKDIGVKQAKKEISTLLSIFDVALSLVTKMGSPEQRCQSIQGTPY